MGLLMFTTHGVINFNHQDRIHEIHTKDCWEKTTIQDCANVGITTRGIITMQDGNALLFPHWDDRSQVMLYEHVM